MRGLCRYKETLFFHGTRASPAPADMKDGYGGWRISTHINVNLRMAYACAPVCRLSRRAPASAAPSVVLARLRFHCGRARRHYPRAAGFRF
ncbi:protein of unknown function [Methylocella tundrae]|uniref:Uncharacterized protein n=1 Tax=Methylocella tundrae TaxID=227605 RepID=A0A4U8YWE7_METTU|nr:protein of unknown function [Methylocella tundrae]